MKAIRLRTEHLINPVGTDLTAPRLFWNCEGGTAQTAWHILARDEDGRVLWDSGEVRSSAMRAAWGAQPVPSRTRVFWRVQLTDETGTPGPWSDEAFFETGLPAGEPWQAKWITGDYRVNPKRRYPVDCFRKAFTASDVKRARLYITACGLYEARLNGQRAGDFILAPGVTDYRRRVQYQTYDVTALLRPGENELTVQLADGWYRGSCGAWGRRNQYGTQTKLLAQLEITRHDGTVQTVATDEGWDWSHDGPIRFADNKDGEVVEAWREPGYGGKAKATAHPVVPSASNNVPVTEHERLTPRLITTPSGKTVLDFGQNIAGYVAFTLRTHQGQRVLLRFGEMLDEDGEFTQRNIQCASKKRVTPLQQAEVFCREGETRYKTTFAIFGFQYVLVETDAPFAPEDFCAVAVCSDMERTGFFDSSNALLNRFVENTVWSAKNNHADLPTDCPTRERHGWTGDAQIFCATACYLFDYRSFGEKFLRDMYDWQRKDGKLPQIAPEGGTDPYMKAMDGSVGWADAGVIMPYVLWKQYGDTDVLRRFLPGMRRYARFMQRRCGRWYPTARRTGLKGGEKKYLSNYGQAYGEWAEPNDVHSTTWKDCAVPHPEVATAYTAHIMSLMAEIEDALGNAAQAAGYRAFAQQCRASYQALRRTRAYTLDTDRQAQLVRPLAFDLLDGEQTAYARKRLLQALERYGWRVGTGFLSTPLILDVLSAYDLDAAYRLLENEALPGWLCMPRNGATTIWEAWEGPHSTHGGIGSLNHYAKGAVCRWLFDTMCGIRIAGENRFLIAPRPGGRFTHAHARYDSVYGTVESGWEIREGEIAYTIAIPANCTAMIRLPDGQERSVGAGYHTFREERHGY
ncbi:MAG: family 78 glycoside hydrolase catalytic domain [Aristaeellaceae bacterium]